MPTPSQDLQSSIAAEISDVVMVRICMMGDGLSSSPQSAPEALEFTYQR
jgi:hypothetical protein